MLMLLYNKVVTIFESIYYRRYKIIIILVRNNRLEEGND